MSRPDSIIDQRTMASQQVRQTVQQAWRQQEALQQVQLVLLVR